MKYLISLGADINSPGQNKQTPLHIVCRKHDDIGFKILIENSNQKINFKIKDSKKKTPLQTALYWSGFSANEDFITMAIEAINSFDDKEILDKKIKKAKKTKSVKL